LPIILFTYFCSAEKEKHLTFSQITRAREQRILEEEEKRKAEEIERMKKVEEKIVSFCFPKSYFRFKLTGLIPMI